MQLSEIPKKFAVTAIVVIVVILAAAAYFLSSSAPAPSSGPTKAYFSVDDGKTWFIDDINKYPPFDHDGKTAVRARVFSADGGKSTFCGYLERYTPEAKAKLEQRDQNTSRNPGSRPQVDVDVILQGIEAKIPGGTLWVNRSAGPAYAEVVMVRGKTPDAKVEEVLP